MDLLGSKWSDRKIYGISAIRMPDGQEEVEPVRTRGGFFTILCGRLL